jgi:hypothetical protein
MSIAAVNLALTAAGQALKAKIEMGEGTLPLDITRIVTASGTSGDPLNLTDVVDEQQEFIITGRLTVGIRTTINAFMTNIGITAGYTLSQIGFYALDPDDGEILYRISQFAEANYVPAPTERGWTYQPSFNFITGNASEVIVNIDPAGLITLQMIWNTTEMSANWTPAADVKTHLYIAWDAPDYNPIQPPDPDSSDAILDVAGAGELDGYVDVDVAAEQWPLDDGIAPMSLQLG